MERVVGHDSHDFARSDDKDGIARWTLRICRSKLHGNRGSITRNRTAYLATRGSCGSAGSSSKRKREVAVRSSSDGEINIKRKVHDGGPITTQLWPRSSAIVVRSKQKSRPQSPEVDG